MITADGEYGVQTSAVITPAPAANHPDRSAASIKATIQAKIAESRGSSAASTPEPVSRIVLPIVINQAPPTATPSEATESPTSLPGPTPDGTVRTAKVPILMYHYLSTPPEDADVYRRDLSVSPELFAAQLDRILAEGYTTISLDELLLNLTQGAPLPEKPVIITFDDGYRDNYQNAFPLLRERGMTATFFVVTDFIDEQRPNYLTWDMVREMAAAGMSFGSHGRNHVSLRDKDTDYLVWQALGSMETLEYEMGVRPRYVAYPAGDYDEKTIQIFKSAGYWAGLTTIQGATHTTDNLFELRRVRVRGTTTPDDLARLLALDW
jgi:peptidoglycan/xylan/chitin deacetylase (PgdA/CDA1 family)